MSCGHTGAFMLASQFYHMAQVVLWFRLLVRFLLADSIIDVSTWWAGTTLTALYHLGITISFILWRPAREALRSIAGGNPV
jgi:hypothetical protein